MLLSQGLSHFRKALLSPEIMRMRTASIALMGLLMCPQLGRAQEPLESGEHQRITYWKKHLEEAGDLDKIPEQERVELLAEVLCGAGDPRDYKTAKEDASALLESTRSKLLAIPKYASYLQTILEELRKQGEADGVIMIRYNLRRSKYLTNVLPQLPSPESVAVLGHYLYDDRDATPDSADSQPQDQVPVPANSWLALAGLSRTNLRDATTGPLNFVDFGKNDPELMDFLKSWRAWFDEVKIGKRPFAFAGQNVEYRF
jgi:hypothetical protein